MPVTYKILEDLHLVLVTFSGDVQLTENADTFLTYLQDPGFRPDHKILIDLAQCAFPHAGAKDVTRLTYQLQPFYDKRAASARTAMYAPEDVPFGMGRMYGAFAEGRASFKIGIFRTAEDALDFLDLEESLVRDRKLLRLN